MEQKARLHPLLSAAAISVMIFSLVAIGAITGVLPHSFATRSPEAIPAAVVPAVSAVPAVPVAQAPAVPAPEIAPEAAPAPKPVKKHVVRHTPAAQPAPVQVAQATAQATPAPAVASSPAPVPVYGPVHEYSPAQVAAAPRQVCNDCGVIDNLREVEVKGKATPLGMIAGGVAGALLGNQFGRGTGKTVMTVAGAAGGAFAGNVVEKKVRAEKKLEITVRMEDGSMRTLTQTTASAWRVGDHVRVVNNQVVSDS